MVDAELHPVAAWPQDFLLANTEWFETTWHFHGIGGLGNCTVGAR